MPSFLNLPREVRDEIYMYHFTSLPCLENIHPKHNGEDWDSNKRFLSSAQDRWATAMYYSRFNLVFNLAFFYSPFAKVVFKSYQRCKVRFDNMTGYIRRLASTAESEVWETYRSPGGEARFLAKPHPRDELCSIFLVNRQIFTEASEIRDRILRLNRRPCYALQVSIGEGHYPLTCISWLHVPFLHREIDTLDIWFETSYTYPERRGSSLDDNLGMIYNGLPYILNSFIRHGPRLIAPYTNESFMFRRSRVPHYCQKNPYYYSVRNIRIHLSAIAGHAHCKPEERLRKEVNSVLGHLLTSYDPAHSDLETGEYIRLSYVWLSIIQYSEGLEILVAEEQGSGCVGETKKYEWRWSGWKAAFEARHGQRR